MSLPFKAFDLELPNNGGTTWVLLGASRSGKTTFMKFLYKKFYKKHITTMFSMNPQADIYGDLSSKVIVSPTYYPQLIEDAHKINQASGNKYPFLFVFDDMVEPRMRTCPSLTRLMTLLRNASCHTIFSTQGRVLMSSTGRAQANYVAIFAQQTVKQWSDVLDEFLSMHLPITMTKREMIEYCRTATTDHKCIFINNLDGEVYITKLSPSQVS